MITPAKSQNYDELCQRYNDGSMILFGLSIPIRCFAFSQCSWLKIPHPDHDSHSLKIPSMAENKRCIFRASDGPRMTKGVEMSRKAESWGLKPCQNYFRIIAICSSTCFFMFFLCSSNINQPSTNHQSTINQPVCSFGSCSALHSLAICSSTLQAEAGSIRMGFCDH